VQTTGLLPVHTPDWQVSVWVHPFPSLQDEPFAFCGLEQTPVAGAHTPALWHWSEAAHTTGLPPVQTPPRQVSVCVQAFASSQLAVLLVWTHPVAGTQESVVHTLLSLQFSAPAPAWQLPPPQVSPVVHALPSSQAIVLLAWTHPLAGAHESVVHTLLSLQFSAPAPAWQLPPEHVSPVVQALPSSHAAVLLAWAHPEPGLHVSVVHTLESSQFNVPAPGWQVPPPQVSPVVQALPSSQAAVLFVKTHPVARVQVSVVHGLLSLHTTPVPPHTPPLHTSPVVHGLPSSQGWVLFVWTHPLPGLQLSVVQTLLSSQTVGVPGWQLPPPHASPVVHAFPSSQAVVLLACTHPVAGLHESSVQALLSLQFGVPAPAWQLPPPHASPIVHAFPSSQVFVLFACTHPVAGAQESVVQTLLSLQSSVPAPAWQLPPEQASPVVQAFPSLHAAVLFA
jgi:hypothetical protein